MSEQGDRWITVATAADVTGRSEGWIYQAIRDHKLRVDHAKNGKGMRLQLVLRSEVVTLSEGSRGHLSDRALFVVRDGARDSDDADTDSSPAHHDISIDDALHKGSELASASRHKSVLSWREAAWGLAGIAWQQGREVEHLRGELSQAQQQIGEERGRRLAAEQRAQAAADEVAALRAQAVRADAIPDRRTGLLRRLFSRGTKAVRDHPEDRTLGS